MSQSKGQTNDLVSLSYQNIFRTFLFWPRIFRLLWDTHPTFLIAILITNLLKGAVPAVILLATRELINSVVAGASGGSFQPVFIAFGVLIGVNLLYDLINIGESFFRKMFQSRLSNQVNIRIIEKAQKMSLQSFEDADVQNMLQRAQGEADYRPFEIFTQILAIMSSVVTLFSTGAILIAWRWWAFLFIFLIPCLSFYSFLRIGQREFNVHFQRAGRQRESWYLSFLVTRDNSFKEVKIFQLGDYLRKRYKTILEGFYREDKVLAVRRSYTSLAFQIVNQGACAFIIFMAIQATYVGQILVGNLVSLIQGITLTQSTSQSIVQGILSLCQNNLYIKQLFDFLDMPEETKMQKSVQHLPLSAIHSIEFRNVSFRYPNTEENAISNVSFTLHQGEKLAIVGRNGSGKSTIVKLLTHLYSDFEGEILINGHSIHELDKDSFRGKIGVVFQDFVHYEMSVRDNIGFGHVAARENDEAIWTAIDKAGIVDLIAGLPEKLNTLLGKWFEDGQQLSGGQWQRIAIARAFMRNADIYVLDEPSSFLDPHAEKEVFQKFDQLVHERIGVFISHRLSSARMADTIILMKEGRIVEAGSHKHLMDMDGVYAEMFRLQASSYLSQGESELEQEMLSPPLVKATGGS
ncbi:ABC transporter ATP-binding protein [Paenibacillus sp. ICGEB2008]|nr:ABC transporter ATP-binding protein [Paenibacillus sp. ICGEB2008]KJD37684.1 ABC transporter ATP-binding protein [Paenibacillus polymyxa]RFT95051.1 ABC transporter ATP-binding protein [Paenibacillus jamilae]KKD55798.1 ABC transporter ATP-binding protein [Paenibacillus sp. ICGEB2008]MBE3648571.1 ABC transporter ATP-binding protein [Paenibacillus polymyxa]QDA25545.1 ABC transporter ATP-binding protein [Paenibacillus polymyxa]